MSRRRPVGGLLSLASPLLLAASTVLPAHAATVGPDDTCATGHLPTYADGNPLVHLGMPTGVFLGHDVIANGEHGYVLRVTHPGTRRVTFDVVVRIERTIHVRRRPVVAGDTVSVSSDGHVLRVHLVPTTQVDGVDFTTDCAVTTSSNARINGVQISRTQYYLGAHHVHPTALPVVLRRS